MTTYDQGKQIFMVKIVGFRFTTWRLGALSLSNNVKFFAISLANTNFYFFYQEEDGVGP